MALASADLRGKLPPAGRLWAGGSAPLQRRPVDGVLPLAAPDQAAVELQRWRLASGTTRGL